jgi:UDP-N-acetylmuramyl pentapeptide phosphotransferase/UDP-N-acetylglucosamine-1-phosphate transferase
MELVGKAFSIALVITLSMGFLLIPWLKRLKFGQNIRSDGPSRHLQKAGTPTMGGIIFLIGISAAVLFVAPQRVDALVVLVLTLGYGLIGFLDDYIKIVFKRSLGLKAREKLPGQLQLNAAQNPSNILPNLVFNYRWQLYLFSMAVILSTRLPCRPPLNSACSQTATISLAKPGPMTRSPNVSILASLCSREAWAEKVS